MYAILKEISRRCCNTPELATAGEWGAFATSGPEGPRGGAHNFRNSVPAIAVRESSLTANVGFCGGKQPLPTMSWQREYKGTNILASCPLICLLLAVSEKSQSASSLFGESESGRANGPCPKQISFD